MANVLFAKASVLCKISGQGGLKFRGKFTLKSPSFTARGRNTFVFWLEDAHLSVQEGDSVILTVKVRANGLVLTDEMGIGNKFLTQQAYSACVNVREIFESITSTWPSLKITEMTLDISGEPVEFSPQNDEEWGFYLSVLDSK